MERVAIPPRRRLPSPPQRGREAAINVSASIPVPPLMSAVETNSLRIMMTAEGLRNLLTNGTEDVTMLCLCLTNLARGIDFALSNDDVPRIAPHLPSLIKQVYKHRKEQSLQVAITLLMLSVKNACRSGWFQSADSDELLKMGNELFSSFSMSSSITVEVSNTLNTLSVIMPRFYPRLSLHNLIVSFEAKPGYETLMTDFSIKRDRPPDQNIVLFVAGTDDLETSSCLVSPPEVSFLVNGKGVARRTNVFLDSGPQLPSDITKMLKYGINIIQAIGKFSGTYIIAVAFMSKITSSDRPILKDYVQPALTALSNDIEIIEGPSKISLKCPISLRRINTPVKGGLCKHYQCFDYDNFVEMNSRKPSWRCPCCNQPTSFVDLCLDRNIANILQDVREDITDILISADGSWKVMNEQNRSSTGQQQSGTLAEQQDDEIVGESNSNPNTSVNVVDLSMDEDVRSDDNPYVIDRKPFENLQDFPVSEFFPAQSLAPHASITSHPPNDICSQTWLSTSASNGTTVPAIVHINSHTVGTLESLVPSSVLNPVITDAISAASGQGSLEVYQPVSTYHNVTHARQLACNMQMLQSEYGNPIVSSESDRTPIPRQVNRDLEIQARAAWNQASSSSSWVTSTDVCYSGLYITSSTPALSGQTIPSVTASSAQTTATRGDTAAWQLSRSLDISPLLQNHSVIQNPDHGCQYHLNSASQQTIGLVATTHTSTRMASGSQSAYRPAMLALSDHQNPLRLPNLRGSQTMVHCTNSPLLPSPSVQVQKASRNASGTAIGSSISHHDQRLAFQRAAQVSSLQSVYPYPFGAGPSFPMMADTSRVMGGEQLQNMAGLMTTSLRADRSSELLLEQNWQPTGRMRGSLTGNAYGAALQHYMDHPSQQWPAMSNSQINVATSDQHLMSAVQQARQRYNPFGQVD